MKKILNRLPGNERGVVLIIVLILLAVGGLTIAPMLSHMATGLKAGQTYEKKTDEYYAADAGVEDALWQITRESRGPLFPSEEGDTWQYSIADINGKSVAITIEYFLNGDPDGNDVYKIDSVASADSSYTAIESYVTHGGGFGFILDNAITTPGDLTLQPGVEVDGNIMCGNPEDQDEEYGAEEYVGDWPTAEDFIDFYLDDVDVNDPFPDELINLNGTDWTTPGPIYRDGDLKIINSSNTPATLTLTNTVYVTGKFEIQNTKSFTLNLAGQTIFVESNSGYPPGAINISDNDCGIEGSGCIIAVGDIYFKPNMQTTEEDFVLVMSIDGTVQFQPSGDFYGSVAGDVSIYLAPNCTLTWREPEEGEVSFPGFGDDTTGKDLKVRTWQTS